MPKPSAQPAQATAPSKLPELLDVFDRASLKEQAEFALMRCASMARVGQEVYGPFNDVRARPLRIVRGGDREPFRCSLDGQRLATGDVLELKIGAGFPEKWLTVWIDGLPDRPFARFLTSHDSHHPFQPTLCWPATWKNPASLILKRLTQNQASLTLTHILAFSVFL